MSIRGRLVSQATAKLSVCVLPPMFGLVGISVGVGFETHCSIFW